MAAIFEDAASATARINSGDIVMIGGFGGIGSPDTLLHGLVQQRCADLTCITTTSGVPDQGLGLLLRQDRVRKLMLCFLTRNPEAVQSYLGGSLDVEFIPMGTMAEAIRAGGSGIPAFYTASGIGTDLVSGRETRDFEGRPFVLTPALKANVSLIRASTADRLGNLTYRRSERTFGPAMATAADLTIAEVDRVVEVGDLDPEQIVTPHAYVDVVVVRDSAISSNEARGRLNAQWSSSDVLIARRVAREVRPGQIVNLGTGIPSLVKNYLTDKSVFLQTENGILGVGPAPEPGTEDYGLTDAMGQLITLDPGASIFDSTEAFAMIRGGHVDITVMGGLQVSERGDLANWSVPKAGRIGVGGAMDLVQGAPQVIIAMNHVDRRGAPKLVRECTLPLTGRQAVDCVITELAIFDVIDGELTLRELQPGVTLADVRDKTEARFRVSRAHTELEGSA
jgi:3-oxoacid CoA-transferase